jgi:hypothetical protein
MHRALLTAGLLLATSAEGWAAGYEMADLQALEKQGSWEELVAHLGDIPPSKRDAKWQGLAERGGAGWLGAIKVDEHHTREAMAVADRILELYPVLKQSKVFMAKRADVGLETFRWTYSDYRHSAGDDGWIDKMLEFVKTDTVTPDLAFRLGKLIDKRLIPVCGYRLFKIALDKQGPQVCKDADFQRTVVGAFEHGSWVQEVTDIAKNKCWGDLKGPLVAALNQNTKDAGLSFRKSACPLLKEKNALGKAETQICESDKAP